MRKYFCCLYPLQDGARFLFCHRQSIETFDRAVLSPSSRRVTDPELRRAAIKM
jgi:hypothetical protein